MSFIRGFPTTINSPGSFDLYPNASISDLNALMIDRSYQFSPPIQLSSGSFNFTGQLNWQPYVSLVGAGRNQTELVFTMTGGADDVNNSAIKFSGTPTPGGWTTTAVTRTYRNSYRVTVTSTAGMTPGDYFYIFGTNGSGEYPSSQGALVIPGEILRIDEISGNDLIVTWRTQVHHEPNQTLYKIDPLINGSIADLTIRGAGLIANGIDISYALKSLVQNVAITGFSRSDIEIRNGSNTSTILETIRLGGSNSHLINSGHQTTLRNLRCDQNGQRFHAFGVKRPMVVNMNDAFGFIGEDWEISKGGIAFMTTSGHGTRVKGVTMSGMLPDQAISSMVAANSLLHAGAPAGVFHTVGSINAQIDYEFGSTYEDLLVQECASELIDNVYTSIAYAYVWHAMQHSSVRNAKALNAGSSTSQFQTPVTDGVNRMGAHFVRDNIGCTMYELWSRGFIFGFTWTGTVNAPVTGLYIDMLNGVPSQQSVPIRGFGDFASIPIPVLNDVTINNNGQSIRCIPSYIPGPGSKLTNVQDGFGFFHEVRFAVNKAGDVVSRHQAVLISTAEAEAISGQLQFKTAMGVADEVIGIVVFPDSVTSNTPTDGTLIAISLLAAGGRVTIEVRSGDTVRPGDILVVDPTVVAGSAGKRWMIDNSPGLNIPCVVAVGSKSAGVVQSIEALCQ